MRMRRTTIALAALAAALALPAAAAAKGPDQASLSGPGLKGAIPIKGEGEGGAGTPLGDLVQFGGFFPAVFGQQPDPMLQARPKGDLGPRYTVTYRVPGPGAGPSRIVQYVYPYAKPGPITYMPPRQVFWATQRTQGGWYDADVLLKRTFVRLGLPATPPAPPADGFPWRTVGWSLAGALALVGLAVAGVLAVRRRSRPAVAH
jgi:hypothetical protein